MSGTPGDDARPAWRVHDLSASDPDGELSGSADLDGATEREIDELMAALVALREAETELSDASRRYMDLGTTDMRALHFLIAAAHKGEIATPGALGQHLGISSGSTTKLLDRLVRAGHVSRAPHPEDRRAVTILVTPSTRSAAMESIGRQHAGRVRAAVRLTSAERHVATRFLQDMAQEISPAGQDWAGRPRPTSGPQDAEGDADAR
ncbi:MarR family transcriptional regulator [Brachybacterium endophyticum]|uniref:MarR family transcriptional regulator n=1 Tax=Brachybacterium endophyticum TaxID=2182385 RepID=A0A2U2RM90_9MICO|nr:MarR family transcriptional regulator [Brachybacterium endophyticum]PWH06989.1 MarR family transcriptional regulator [Brachybacterium endophyticum]